MDYKAIGLALVAIVIAIGAYLHGGSTIVKNVGGIGTSCGGSISCVLGDFLASGSLYLGGNDPSTSAQIVAGRRSLSQATTTVCSIQSPAATSTLVYAGIQMNVSSSSAEILDIAQATTAYASTTKIGTTYNVAAGAQATVVASTSPAAGAATLFAPNTFLNFKTQGGTTGEAASAAASAGYVPTGACSFEFLLNN